jgi:hypothetical protein
MPRVRFSIRTIMIVIAVLAMLIGFLVELLRWVAGPEADPPNSLLYLVLAMTLGPLLLYFIVIAINFWRGRARHREFPTGDSSPSQTANPARSGEPKRV